LFLSLLAVNSCSSSVPVSNSVKSVEKEWFRFHKSGGHSNVYRFSLLPLKIDKKNTTYLKKHYSLKKDFSSPNELIKTLTLSGHKAKLVKRKGLSWNWHPNKYLISHLIYYEVNITKSGDIESNVTASYIDKTNLLKIKNCLVMYTEIVGTLSSEECLRKYIIE